MSEKKKIKTSPRKTSRYRSLQSNFIIKNVNNLLSVIETIIEKNDLKTEIFKDVFNKIYKNVSLFSNQYEKIGGKKIKKIENDMMKIRYNRKLDIKSKLFGFIELLNDFGIYLNDKKHKEILNTRDEINLHLHHFIMLLNGSTSRVTEELMLV